MPTFTDRPQLQPHRAAAAVDDPAWLEQVLAEAEAGWLGETNEADTVRLGDVGARVNALLDHVAPDVAEGLGAAGATDRSEAQWPDAARCRAVVADLDRAITRLQSVRLRVVRAADRARVADAAGHTGTSAWLAGVSRTGGASAADDVRLAGALADALPSTSTALAAGDVSTQHAGVIAWAMRRLPDSLPEPERDRVEQSLVTMASHSTVADLRRSARRAMAAAESTTPEQADAAEESALADQEAAALARTRLTMRDNGDGTTTGRFVLPVLQASMLRKVVQSMTSPRRTGPHPDSGDGRSCGSLGSRSGEGDRRLGSRNGQGEQQDAVSSREVAASPPRDWAHQNGLAFAQLLEHLPTDHLHGKVAATVLVTVDKDQLIAGAGAAHLDTGHDISTAQARHLACNAGLIPAVLDGPGLPLDLGRERRLFTQAQRVALATRYDSCAADGCDRPFAWCEVHHERPWSDGGRTDLANAVPLCWYHHRLIDDPEYHHRTTTDAVSGRHTVTYRRRARWFASSPDDGFDSSPDAADEPGQRTGPADWALPL